MSVAPYPEYKDSGVEWIGAVPAHWNVLAIKRLSPVQRGASPRPIDDPRYFDDDGEFAWVRIADVTASDGLLTETTQRLSVLGASLSVQIAPGELFVSIAGSVGKPCVAGIKACIHDGFVYFPHLQDYRRLLFRIFEAGHCYAGLGKMGTQLNLNTDTIGAIKVPVAPPEEQSAIAAFLDQETGKIDALVAEQERLIALLKEKRQAVISKAVTKGLNPNATMKDSGIEWLGQVPAHWEVGHLRQFCLGISTGPFGTALGSSDYITDGVPVINPSHIVDGRCVPASDITVSKETAERLSPWALATGDVVTARRGELGRAAVVGEAESGWICGTGSLRLRPDGNLTLSQYLFRVFECLYAREWLELASVGSTMANINEAIIGSLPVALPLSDEERVQILLHIESESSKIDALMLDATQAITLLRERRAALISAAVTGKIDVRAFAPSQPEAA